MTSHKPILCLDFDGVLHSYTSGWKGAGNIPDPPVEGAMQFLTDAVERFEVHIFSSRSNQFGGIHAMKSWVERHLIEYWGPHRMTAEDTFVSIKWPKEKPPAHVSIDDRAWTFEGKWPDLDEVAAFKPWNKRNLPTGGRR